jgi:hypothetical protein
LAADPGAGERAGGGRSTLGATAPWNSGEISGSSRRRCASADRSCQRTLRGATRRITDSVSTRAPGVRLRRVEVGRRSVLPVRSRSTAAEITLPLLGRPPCFSATYQCAAPGSVAIRSGTVPSPSCSSV